MPYAIITGASQGIGKAIAETLLHHGYSIAISARNKEKLMLAEQEWNERYPEASILIYPTDLSVAENAKAFAQETLSIFGTVDILVNNAGLFIPGNITEEPDGRLETIMATNLYSAYHLSREIAPVMMKNRSGHIFNMCSVASLKAYPNGGSYSISKYALLGFSENLREELRPYLVKVTSICPGAVYTPSWEGSGVERDRIMEANDIADVVLAASQLSPQANMETIVLRPVKGDL
jgi:short-subunit dehydrogenase